MVAITGGGSRRTCTCTMNGHRTGPQQTSPLVFFNWIPPPVCLHSFATWNEGKSYCHISQREGGGAQTLQKTKKNAKKNQQRKIIWNLYVNSFLSRIYSFLLERILKNISSFALFIVQHCVWNMLNLNKKRQFIGQNKQTKNNRKKCAKILVSGRNRAKIRNYLSKKASTMTTDVCLRRGAVTK